MRNNNVMKMIATSVAISFCFTALFIIILFFTGNSKINYYIFLINTTVVDLNGASYKKTEYDVQTKRIINYPKYGTEYATLILESLDIKLPVYHGDSLSILRNGIGHYAGSYFPGEGGTIIFAGHYTKNYFRSLGYLEVGDLVTIEANYGTFTYMVDSFKVIDEKDLSAFPINKDKEMLIMYTCYPFDTLGRHSERYVVYASLVGDSHEK